MFLGKGHNAGDALCAAKHLRSWGWRLEIDAVFPEIEWATLTSQQFRALEAVPESPRNAQEPVVIVDALLGIGARGELREPILGAVRRLCERRLRHATPVVALDLPTGLDADNGNSFDVTVVADYTFFIGAPKNGLLAAQSINYVGRLEAIDLGEIPADTGNPLKRLIVPASFPASLPLRPHDFHKGNAGRVSVVAGSIGMEGAALLCATAALRAGAGLVTLWVKQEIHTAVVARATPELMVRAYQDWTDIAIEQADALVVGPGLGPMDEREFEVMAGLLTSSQTPSVIDADALNAIARFQGHYCLRENHVITPHPGEFRRLSATSADLSREEACAHFTEFHPSILLLKGARTLVQQRGGPLYHNPTGHAGMATAGMGDVLSGVIAGLLAQGLLPMTSACAGAWICGRAAELAALGNFSSQHATLASDLFDFMGSSISEWQHA
ncbi:MAG: hypothetical protein RI957_1007 [Verrucomicrobiota bacterium]